MNKPPITSVLTSDEVASSFACTTVAISDTVKKARVWLDSQGTAYTFHDYKKEDADPARIAAWIADAGLDFVVNRKGTTYRALSDADKALAASADTAPALLAANPSVIKRPIAEHPGGLLVGFKPEDWAAALG